MDCITKHVVPKLYIHVSYFLSISFEYCLKDMFKRGGDLSASTSMVNLY